MVLDMAFSIKNEQADQLVRHLTAITGESLTDAVIVSLQERLDRLRERPEVVQRRRRLEMFAHEFAELEAEHRRRLGMDDDEEFADPLQWDEIGLPV